MLITSQQASMGIPVEAHGCRLTVESEQGEGGRVGSGWLTQHDPEKLSKGRLPDLDVGA